MSVESEARGPNKSGLVDFGLIFVLKKRVARLVLERVSAGRGWVLITKVR